MSVDFLTLEMKLQKEEEDMQQEEVAKFVQNDLEEKMKTLQSYNSEMVGNLSLGEMIEEKYGDLINNDLQTRNVCEFITLATNFASLDLKARLTETPKLVATLQNLFDELRKETAEFADLAGEVQNIFQSYIRMVMNAQDSAAKVLPYIKKSTKQVEILQDILNPKSENPLTSIDKEDIKIAVNAMVKGIKEVAELAKSQKEESEKIQDRISAMNKVVDGKKLIVEQRLNFSNTSFSILGSVVGGAVSGILSQLATTFGIEAKTLGEPAAGALVVGGLALNPVGMVVLATAIGGIAVGGLVFLVQKLYQRHQTGALKLLDKILTELQKLNQLNLSFSKWMQYSGQDANEVKANLETIQLCLTNETQRKANSDICDETLKSIQNTISGLKEISNIPLDQFIQFEPSNHGLIGFKISKIPRIQFERELIN